MSPKQDTRERIRTILQLEAALDGRPGWLNDVFDAVAVAGFRLEELPSWSATDLVARLLMTPEQADRFLKTASHASGFAERLVRPHLSVVLRTDECWPRRIADTARDVMAPWLYVVGDPALLGQYTVGIVGSRDATPRSLEIAGQLASHVTSRNATVVSGGARGVDSAAHRAALERGGRTVVVLAQGIGTYTVPDHWWAWIERGEMTVLSEFSPFASWESSHALQRNGTIARLSAAFVVVQAETMSGTMSAGRSALRLKRPLYVVQQTGAGAERFAGSEELIARGGAALPVDGGEIVAVEDVEPLLTSQADVSATPAQMRMF